MRLDEQMQEHEKAGKGCVPAGNKYAIFRYDGVAFGSYTRGLDAPEDKQFMEDMDAAATTLVKHFSAVGAYVVSDEISLILKADDEGVFVYGGAYQKLATIGASVLSVEMSRLRPYQQAAYFDGRGRPALDDDAVRAYLFWRQRGAEKNAVSMVVSAYLKKKGQRDVEGMPTDQRVRYLTDAGVDYLGVTSQGFRSGRAVKQLVSRQSVSWVHNRTGESHTTVAERREHVIADAGRVPGLDAAAGWTVADYFNAGSVDA